jgi:MerR family transcriptional regulator, light-induced transcriptional regulator
MDGLYTQALELFLRRAGLRVLTLPVDLDSTRVGSALRALQPRAMVLAGRNSSLEAIGRLVYATRQSGGDLRVFDYRGALPDTGASTVARIGPGPVEAVAMLRERLSDLTHTYNGRPDDGSPKTRLASAARSGRAPRFAGARAEGTQALA